MFRVSLLLASLTAAIAQWSDVCPGSKGGPYSSYNRTSCDAQGTCCPSGFSVSGVGCCPLPDAVCCPNGYACCPSGTECIPVTGPGYGQIFNCTAPSGDVEINYSVCKPGPPIPYSTTLKNILVIGDSLSIGYTPQLAIDFVDKALVQHAPWDVSDGGAEETLYGLRCLKYFLASPAGFSISPDLVVFNWGMHDGIMGNTTVPGQNGDPTEYAAQLLNITQALVAWAKPRNTQLLYALTTAYMCSETSDGCAQNLNNQASAIMAQYNIPTVDNHATVIDLCGPVPNAACQKMAGCFCPHCPALYKELAAPMAVVISKMLNI